jgi:hypothetical protein
MELQCRAQVDKGQPSINHDRDLTECRAAWCILSACMIECTFLHAVGPASMSAQDYATVFAPVYVCRS